MSVFGTFGMLLGLNNTVLHCGADDSFTNTTVFQTWWPGGDMWVGEYSREGSQLGVEGWLAVVWARSVTPVLSTTLWQHCVSLQHMVCQQTGCYPVLQDCSTSVLQLSLLLALAAGPQQSPHLVTDVEKASLRLAIWSPCCRQLVAGRSERLLFTLKFKALCYPCDTCLLLRLLRPSLCVVVCVGPALPCITQLQVHARVA